MIAVCKKYCPYMRITNVRANVLKKGCSIARSIESNNSFTLLMSCHLTFLANCFYREVGMIRNCPFSGSHFTTIPVVNIFLISLSIANLVSLETLHGRTVELYGGESVKLMTSPLTICIIVSSSSNSDSLLHSF